MSTVTSEQFYNACWSGIHLDNEVAVIDKYLIQNPHVEIYNGVLMNALYNVRDNPHYLAKVKRLLQDPRIDPAYDDNRPIIESIRFGSLVVVDFMLSLEDPRVDPTVNRHSPLRIAVDYGHTKVVRRLLEDPRIDPNATNVNILAVAAGHAGGIVYHGGDGSHFEIVKLLLQDPRIDPSANDNLAIISACSMYPNNYNKLAVVDRLLEDPRVDPSARNNLALRLITKYHNDARVAPDGIQFALDVINRLKQDPRVNQLLNDDKINENKTHEELFSEIKDEIWGVN